jgi:putative PIN family toxin of toxin-antitoxin system
MDIVMDTDVLVAAFRSRTGASRVWLEAVFDREVRLLASVPLFLEYEAVLSREEHRAAIGLEPRELLEVLDDLAALLVPVDLHFRYRPTGTDPADEIVVETAINGRTGIVLTFNERHLAEPCGRHGIGVSRPGPALRQWRRDHGTLRP